MPRRRGTQVGEAWLPKWCLLRKLMLVDCDSLTCSTVRQYGSGETTYDRGVSADDISYLRIAGGLGGRLQKRSASCGQYRAPLFYFLARKEQLG